MGSRLLYQPSGLVLARVSTDPGDLELPDLLDLLDSEEPGCRSWLERIWDRADVRAAIGLASPALAEHIGKFLATGGAPAQRTRLVLAVASYLLRWQRRPTPFGLFAGVTSARVGHTVAAVFGAGHRVAVRADGQWLSALADRLETHPAVLPRLLVIANSAGIVRGDRFVVSARPSDGAGPGPLREISIRHIPPVQVALAEAATPIPFHRLVSHVAATFPAVPPGKIAATLTALVNQQVLLTSLRPPSTVVDGLPYVMDQLLAAVGGLPDLAPLLADLTDIHRELVRHHTLVSLADTVSLTARMRALCDVTEHVLAANTAVDGDITLPPAVLDEAASAASALLRLTARPFGAEVWRDFHLRFRARYGPGALVSVRELIADSGLGMPGGFLGASHGRPARIVTDRDTKLLALIQEAAVDGRQEITLTEQMIETLTVADNPAEMVAPPRVELAFELHATDADALQRGRFELWLTGAPRSQSSMVGRFAPLLPEMGERLLAASYPMVPGEHAVAAQLSFSPRRRHSDNVVRAPQLLPAVIPVGEHPAAGVETISVDDLAVTADSTQMYLVQISMGRGVVPWVLHALDASVHTPALARFLSGVASARHAVYGAFDFGAARTLPHLPRVRYGRTVLAPARWMLTATGMAAPREPMRAWEKTLDAWRERWKVPSLVVLHQDGQRLPLDLDSHLDLVVLRSRLNRAGRLELREAHTAPGQGWIGRACEFVVPLTAMANRPARMPAAVQRPPAMLMPGSGDLIHAQVLGHPDRYDEILTEHLPQLLGSLPLSGWWFSRHRDTIRPDTCQQLWLYLHLSDPAGYGEAAAELAAFASHLQARGLLASLTLAAYQPQTGRYGPGAAMAAAHEVAAADSAAALAQITMSHRAGLPGQAIAAASMADLAASLATGPGEGGRWLVNVLPHESGKLDRGLREAALLLADPVDDEQALRRHPGADQVATAWAARRTALTAYRIQLTPHREPVTVLRTLLHDHHVRSLGVDPDQESVTNRLARAISLRFLARTSQETR